MATNRARATPALTRLVLVWAAVCCGTAPACASSQSLLSRLRELPRRTDWAVRSSSSWVGDGYLHDGGQVLDASERTFWCPLPGHNASSHVVFDLGAPTSLSAVSLASLAVHDGGGLGAEDHTVRTAEWQRGTGASWSTVARLVVADHHREAAAAAAGAPQFFHFDDSGASSPVPNVTSRFWRLRVTSTWGAYLRGDGAESRSLWPPHVSDVRLYTHAANLSAPSPCTDPHGVLPHRSRKGLTGCKSWGASANREGAETCSFIMGRETTVSQPFRYRTGGDTEYWLEVDLAAQSTVTRIETLVLADPSYTPGTSTLGGETGFSGLRVQVQDPSSGAWADRYESDYMWGRYGRHARYTTLATGFEFGVWNQHVLDAASITSRVRLRFGYADQNSDSCVTFHGLKIVGPGGPGKTELCTCGDDGVLCNPGEFCVAEWGTCHAHPRCAYRDGSAPNPPTPSGGCVCGPGGLAFPVEEDEHNEDNDVERVDLGRVPVGLSNICGKDFGFGSTGRFCVEAFSRCQPLPAQAACRPGQLHVTMLRRPMLSTRSQSSAGRRGGAGNSSSSSITAHAANSTAGAPPPSGLPQPTIAVDFAHGLASVSPTALRRHDAVANAPLPVAVLPLVRVAGRSQRWLFDGIYGASASRRRQPAHHLQAVEGPGQCAYGTAVNTMHPQGGDSFEVTTVAFAADTGTWTARGHALSHDGGQWTLDAWIRGPFTPLQNVEEIGCDSDLCALRANNTVHRLASTPLNDSHAAWSARTRTLGVVWAAAEQGDDGVLDAAFREAAPPLSLDDPDLFGADGKRWVRLTVVAGDNDGGNGNAGSGRSKFYIDGVLRGVADYAARGGLQYIGGAAVESSPGARFGTFARFRFYANTAFTEQEVGRLAAGAASSAAGDGIVDSAKAAIDYCNETRLWSGCVPVPTPCRSDAISPVRLDRQRTSLLRALRPSAASTVTQITPLGDRCWCGKWSASATPPVGCSWAGGVVPVCTFLSPGHTAFGPTVDSIGGEGGFFHSTFCRRGDYCWGGEIGSCATAALPADVALRAGEKTLELSATLQVPNATAAAGVLGGTADDDDDDSDRDAMVISSTWTSSGVPGQAQRLRFPNCLPYRVEGSSRFGRDGASQARVTLLRHALEVNFNTETNNRFGSHMKSELPEFTQPYTYVSSAHLTEKREAFKDACEAYCVGFKFSAVTTRYDQEVDSRGYNRGFLVTSFSCGCGTRSL